MNATLSVEIAVPCLLTLLALWLVVLREAWRAWKPARLLLAGRYAEARAAAGRVERSWMRVFGSVRISTRYVIGCALHLEGDLEGSLEALAPLHALRLEGTIRYAVSSIDAASLVLLDRDPERATALLEDAAKIHRPPEDILLAAHAKLSAGDQDGARRLFAAAGNERRGGLRLDRRGSVVLVEDQRQQEGIFHALRGLYLVKVGRASEAQRDFAIASRSAITNVYVERARALLLPTAPDADARSSLAPQVVTKDIGAT